MIKAKDIHKSFGEIEAVRGVSFDIPAGEIFGFLGPNGAGKTTTINILCTLLKPDRGTAVLAGHDVVECPADVRAALSTYESLAIRKRRRFGAARGAFHRSYLRHFRQTR